MSGPSETNEGPVISLKPCRGPSGSGRCPGGLGEDLTNALVLLDFEEDDEPVPPGTAAPLEAPSPEGVLGTAGHWQLEKSLLCAIFGP